MTLETDNSRLNPTKVKKQAHSVHARLEHLGHKTPLGHAYEVLATALGFRNYATMSAKAGARERMIEIGAESYHRKKVKLPLSEFADHVEIIGWTGTGAHEFQSNFAIDAIENGETLISINSHGDVAAAGRVFYASHFYNRADDVKLINFMSGREQSMSERYNPFVTDSAEDLADLIINLQSDQNSQPEAIEADGDCPDQQPSNHVYLLLRAVLEALVWKQRGNAVIIKPSTIIAYLSLEKLSSIMRPEDKNWWPKKLSEAVNNYLTSIGEEDLNSFLKGRSFSSIAHRVAVNRLSRILEPLATTFGFMFEQTELVTTIDSVIDKNQILTILLPAAETMSPDHARILIRLVYLDVIRAIRKRDTMKNNKPVVVTVAAQSEFMPQNLSETMEIASANNGRLVFAWENSPVASALKKSMTIHTTEGIGSYGYSTVVTKDRQIDVFLKWPDWQKFRDAAKGLKPKI